MFRMHDSETLTLRNDALNHPTFTFSLRKPERERAQENLFNFPDYEDLVIC